MDDLDMIQYLKRQRMRAIAMNQGLAVLSSSAIIAFYYVVDWEGLLFCRKTIQDNKKEAAAANTSNGNNANVQPPPGFNVSLSGDRPDGETGSIGDRGATVELTREKLAKKLENIFNDEMKKQYPYFNVASDVYGFRYQFTQYFVKHIKEAWLATPGVKLDNIRKDTIQQLHDKIDKLVGEKILIRNQYLAAKKKRLGEINRKAYLDFLKLGYYTERDLYLNSMMWIGPDFQIHTNSWYGNQPNKDKELAAVKKNTMDYTVLGDKIAAIGKKYEDAANNYSFDYSHLGEFIKILKKAMDAEYANGGYDFRMP